MFINRVFIIIALISATTLNAQIRLSSPVRFLALGDSYTIGQGVSIYESWPYQLAEGLILSGFNIDTLNLIAQTGWTTTRLQAEIDEANLNNDYSLVSLLIGVNDQYQGKSIENYPGNFEKLLLKAIELAGYDKNRVFVLSIPDYGYTPFGSSNQESISKEIDEYNAINRRVSLENNIHYIDITEISRSGLLYPDLIASDGLHPSSKMYKLWVNEILLYIDGISKQDNIISQQQQEIQTFPSIIYDYISVQNAKPASIINFYSIEGKLAFSKDLNSDKELFNIGSLEHGIYYFNIVSKGQILSTGKIIKQ